MQAMDLHWPTPSRVVNDCVYLKDLQISKAVGTDAWGREGKAQPMLISLKWYNDLSGKDDLKETLSYSKISKDVVKAISEEYGSFTSAHTLADFIYTISVVNNWGGVGLTVQIHLPKAVLHANNGLKYVSHYQLRELPGNRHFFDEDQLYPKTLIEDVKLSCIIGVNEHERLSKQIVRADFIIEEELQLFSHSGIDSNWRGLVRQAVEVSRSEYFKSLR